MKKIFITIIAMLLPMMASADDSGQCGENVYYSYDSATHTLTISGSGDMWNTDIEVFHPWNSYRGDIQYLYIESGVTFVGNYVFSNCSGITAIVVENGNQHYDSRNNCNAIIETSSNTLVVGCKNTTIPNSVMSIGESAFLRCSGLTSITIPNSVTIIEKYAFLDCTNLNSITIPNSVMSIGESAFLRCSGLTSITIPNSMTSIGDLAFEGCNSLTSITLPDGVTNIGERAFFECTSLTSITIPNSVTSIGGRAFFGCTNLTSITMPNTMISIGENAFTDTGWYKNQPDGLIYIDQLAYQYKGTMPDNTSIIIKDGTTRINDRAFWLCSGLTSVTIPNSVTNIGGGAFFGCSGLSSIIVKGGNPYYDSRDNCNAIIETSSNTLVMGCKGTTIPNSVTSIGERAFENCTGLSSITIPNSVTSMGESAFFQCSGLTSITIPNSITSISRYAFYGCSSLASVTIGNSVTYIGGGAFLGCSGLTSITIGNSVTSIGEYAFQGCSGLTSITIPNSVTSIENYSFQDCSSLTSVTIPNSVTYIGGGAFLGCNSLKSVTIPNSITNLGSAFSGCNGLTSITIPNSVTSIGDWAFLDCSGLTFITIPNSVKSIGEHTFSGCSGLKYICLTSDKYPCSASLGNTSCQYIVPQTAYDGGIPKDVTHYATYGVSPKYIKVKSTTATSAILELTPIDATSGDLRGTTYEVTMFNLKPGSPVSGFWKYGTVDQGVFGIPDAKTKNLVMNAQQAKAMSNTKAKLSATVKEPDDDKHYGFEWRRIDVESSNFLYSQLYKGQMVGTLSNLNPGISYKYRPFYKSDSGEFFYGEWISFHTGDTSTFFEPEVHTNEPVALTQDGAQLSGVWVEGTEDIQEKGIEYWPKNNGARPVNATRGSNVTAVIVKGNDTSITLDGLEPGTEYVYRSYMKTLSGTTYGEEVTFKTPLPGDANNDGKINVADIVEINNAKAGNPSASFNMTNADTDGDGSLTEADITAIVNIIMK